TTPDANARHRRLTAAGECLAVIEFEELARLTTVTGFAHERALAAVALPDRPLDRRGDVPRARSPALVPAGPLGRGELGLLQLADVRLERTAEDLREIPGRDLVAGQCLGIRQVIEGALADAELQREPPGRQGYHLGPRRGGLNAPRGALLPNGPRGLLLGHRRD